MDINAFTRLFEDAEDQDLTIDGVTECAGYDDQYLILGFRHGVYGAWEVREAIHPEEARPDRHYYWNQVTRNSGDILRADAAKVCAYLAK